MDKVYQDDDETKYLSVFQPAGCQAFRVWSDARQAKVWTTAVFDSGLKGRDTNLVSHRLLQSLGCISSTVTWQTQQFQTLAGTIRSIGSLELKLSQIIFSRGVPREQAAKCVKFHILTDDGLLADLVLGADHLSRNATSAFIEQAFEYALKLDARAAFARKGDLSSKLAILSRSPTRQNGGFGTLTDMVHTSPLGSEDRVSIADYNSATPGLSGHETMSTGQLNRLRQVLESSRPECHTVIVGGSSIMVWYYDCPYSGCRHTWTNGFRQIQDLCQHILAVHLREI